LGVGALVAQALQCSVDAFDFAQPSLGRGAFPTFDQVGLQVVESRQHLGVDVELGAAQAGLTEMILMWFSEHDSQSGD
jgi:hypothetical protein